ncbi:Transcriptional activator [Chytriomyces hyalinus]|nr:Transcriptional activator [Chytriomyces hyalinus]
MDHSQQYQQHSQQQQHSSPHRAQESEFPYKQTTIQTAEEQPMYVNAKQYHRILKRREARAALMAKMRPSSKTNAPYAHESRHKHAMRRPRGPGGRFLSAAELAAWKELEAINSDANNVSKAIAIVAAANAKSATNATDPFSAQLSSSLQKRKKDSNPVHLSESETLFSPKNREEISRGAVGAKTHQVQIARISPQKETGEEEARYPTLALFRSFLKQCNPFNRDSLLEVIKKNITILKRSVAPGDDEQHRLGGIPHEAITQLVQSYTKVLDDQILTLTDKLRRREEEMEKEQDIYGDSLLRLFHEIKQPEDETEKKFFQELKELQSRCC